MALQHHLSITTALWAALMTAVVSFLVKLYEARSAIGRLRQQGLSMPPWNPIFGHLYFCYKVTSRLSRDAHPNYLPDTIRRELPELGPIFYLDTWPIGPQMLVVASTRGLYQITQEHSLPKHPRLKHFLNPIAGGLDLVTMEGALWKKWRGIFNPGFSSTYLMSLAGGIVEETEHFCKNLQSLAQDHALFHMKDLTDNLTMDVIGRIVMNVHLSSQTQRANKSIIDLVLTSYLSDRSPNSFANMDPTFKTFTMNQIKLFLFSGHDTTSSTVCYIFYALTTKPDILKRVRDEHNSVFGLNPQEAPELITADPYLLNQLPYTLAVIKEVLRLYPAVSGTRIGELGFHLIDDAGRHFPTRDFLVWDIG
ncbi:MAG: hypothetical protein Q9215_006483 [Flavoplaca cf. flavocitrina]